MAARIKIPVNDHDDVCATHYLVEYKQDTEPSYSSLQNQIAVEDGSPPQWVLIVENLVEDVLYDIRVTRYCCDGTVSTPTTTTVLTTP